MPARSRRQAPIMSRLIHSIEGAVNRARGNTHDATTLAKHFAEQSLNASDDQLVDVSIQFIGASGLPKMDLVGSADPYFVAKIDGGITFVSTVQPNTQSPVWNDVWNVLNVPTNAALKVEVLDKDEGSVVDDYIGSFETTLNSGARELDIQSSIRKKVKGTFWLNITATPAAQSDLPRYTFDGPIRFSRHFSPTVGHLTKINDERLYSTWKMNIKGVPLFFDDHYQHWNTSYHAAQTIFGPGPGSLAVRTSIQAAHRMLYARSTRNGFGVIQSEQDIVHLLHGGTAHRVKPAVYTYIIAEGDDTFRFSETGAAFFVDFASKHALHANCAERVRYSGEFHPRPQGGWANFSDEIPDDQVEWELVIDNNSGTYSPDKALLPRLQALLEYNFSGFKVVALDHGDPELEQSREACRAYALEHRGVQKTELQPHTSAGEETLLHHASLHTVTTEHPDEIPPASRTNTMASETASSI